MYLVYQLTISLYFAKVFLMQDSCTSVWQTPAARQFAEVIAAIDDVQTMQNFLRDVMTEKEIIEISSRLEAAKMLKQGKKYTEIIEKTKLSSRTIARISDWMQNGCGGYEAALKIATTHHDHIPPARRWRFCIPHILSHLPQ
jgi:TrpR-related protein YerC/YecD